MGFFADVGPMQIFVSIHLIPPDLKFLPDANPPNFSNEEQVIEKGAMVRVKIMGLRMDVRDIVFPQNTLTLVCYRHYQRGLPRCSLILDVRIVHLFSPGIVACLLAVFAVSSHFFVEDTPVVVHCERYLSVFGI
jgi:hypothetical protein